MGCTETTITSTKSCCTWPDPAFTVTSGASAVDITGGSSGVAVGDSIQLYAENALSITTTDNTNQTLVEFTLDFSNLSTQQQSDFCTQVTNCVAIGLDAYTKAETDALLALKQDLLTFDATPTNLSTNPVTSTGIYNYLLNYFNTTTQTSDAITEGTTNLFLTAAERSKLAGLPSAVEWTSTAATTHLVTGTNTVGIGNSAATAKLQVTGNGATVGTQSLLIENSVSTAAVSITDDTAVAIQTDELVVTATGDTEIKTLKAVETIWEKVTTSVTNENVPANTTIVIIDTGLQPVTVTLPLASAAWDATNSVGRIITFKRKTSDTTGNAATIEGNGAETIDGAANVTLNPGNSVTMVSEGTEWVII